MTLWSGRFDTAPDPAAFDFGISFGFDRALFEDDVTGSLAWADALASRGRLVEGIKLQDEGGRLLIRAGGRTSVTDAAYAETKEVIGGFFIVRAEDYDEAVQIASDCPHLENGKILLREIHDLSGAAD